MRAGPELSHRLGLRGTEDDYLEINAPGARRLAALGAQLEDSLTRHPAVSVGLMVNAIDEELARVERACLLERDGAPAGTVFKIERDKEGQKIAYVRMFSGTINTRDRVHFGAGLESKVTRLAIFDRGPAVQRQAVAAGAVGYGEAVVRLVVTLSAFMRVRDAPRIGVADADRQQEDRRH